MVALLNPTRRRNKLASSSTGFTPRGIPGCRLWLQDDRGILEDPMNLGFSSAWTDQSGFSNGFTQAVGVAQPGILIGGGPNGRNALDFDGANDFMEGPLVNAVASATAWYCMAVFRVDAFTQNSPDATAYLNPGILFDRTPAGDLGMIVRGVGAAGELLSYSFDGNSDVASVPLATGVWTLAEVRHDAGFLYSRTESQAETSAASGTTLTPIGVFELGHGYSNLAWFDGRMSFVVGYNRSPTAAERLLLRTAVAARYGITVTV